MKDICTFKGDKGIVCWVYSIYGDYGKPYLIISDNDSGTKYFQHIANAFEKELNDIGLNTPLCELGRSTYSYRLPDIKSWWNRKEQRWYEQEEYEEVLMNVFKSIKEDFVAGKFDGE